MSIKKTPAAKRRRRDSRRNSSTPRTGNSVPPWAMAPCWRGPASAASAGAKAARAARAMGLPG
eukprot:5800028-Lingulodinium_polyedra.AAC.1